MLSGRRLTVVLTLVFMFFDQYIILLKSYHTADRKRAEVVNKAKYVEFLHATCNKT